MPKMDAAGLSETIPLCWMTQKTVMFTEVLCLLWS